MSRNATGLAFAVALTAAVAALTGACQDPAPAAPGCEGAACQTGGAGTGGGDCPDLSRAGGCSFQGQGDACPGDALCTLASTICSGGARCCTLPFSCEPPEGVRPGGFACEEDDQCASGRCLELPNGARACLRACQEAPEDSCPEGFACILVPLRADLTVRACVGTTDGALDYQRTQCHDDRDCLEGRSCQLVGAERLRAGVPVPTCLPVQPPSETLGHSCLGPGETIPLYGELSANCTQGELCWHACEEGDADVCRCSAAQVGGVDCPSLRCTRICRVDADCPDRTTCQLLDGTTEAFPDPDFSFRFCELLPGNVSDWGCFDETDCCVGGRQRDGNLCCRYEGAACNAGLPPVELTHCRALADGARYVTQCVQPDGGAGIGSPCAADGDCESRICVPDGAGGGLCSSPCLASADRCAGILPGSSCCGAPWGESPCLEACRLDCAAIPGCGG